MTKQGQVRTTCCVVGGGPAGMMLGYLLARAGVMVTVLEKHADFFRDFRGDTVHASTLEVLHELGLLEEFLQVPHQRVNAVSLVIGDARLPIADFTHLPTQCKFTALMPQWDFLNFLAERARRFASFSLLMQHEAVGLLWDRDRVAGVQAKTPDGEVEISADLVISCDGRHSRMRQAALLPLRETGVPIDVLWFRISRRDGDPGQVLGTVNYGRALVLIDRKDYFQAGLIVRKGSLSDIQRTGLEVFRQSIAQMAPFLADRVSELQDWDQIKLLTVQINRLERWYRAGLLCIGDAAHAMSPAGGVGINLAIQDAVAAARILFAPLRERRVTRQDLQAVQSRRMLPTRLTQAAQVQGHKLLAKVFDTQGALKPPAAMCMVTSIPGFQRLTGYAVGVGVRPEHVREPVVNPFVKPAVLAGVACAFLTNAVRTVRRRALAAA